jgi:hypothetical protein
MDKFNIIHKLNDNNKNYESIIKNYIENYFESEINVYHPDYMYQITWNNKVEKDKLVELYNNYLDKYLIQKCQDLRTLIKKEKFSLTSLNKCIDLLNLKIVKSLNILNLNIKHDFVIKLLSDPNLINFIELELINFEADTEKFIIDIKKLCSVINSLSNQYIWFLKFISSVLRNNVMNYEFNIPIKYNKLYEIYYIFDYIIKIKSIYEFLSNDINYILKPIYDIVKIKIIDVIKLCNASDLYNLIKLKAINLLDDDEFKNNLKSEINLYLRDNKEKLFPDFLDFILFCNSINILDNYVLLIFEEESVMNIIFDIIHNNIRSNEKLVKNILVLLSNIENKDKFLTKYHELLIERLLSDNIESFSFVENIEKRIVNTLKLYFNHKIIKKIEKVLHDYITSYNDIKHYNTVNQYNNFVTVTTSYLNWNINYDEGYVNLSETRNALENSQLICKSVKSTSHRFENSLLVYKDIEYREQEKSTLTSYIIDYQNYYNTIYSEKRKLQWVLQYGEVNITYNNVNITLLPIQLLVLELFNSNLSLSLNDILSQKFFDNYSNKFKNDIINSLLNSRILNLENNQVYLSNSNNIETNLIDISYEYISKQNITENSHIELAFSYEQIVKSIINHHVKVESKNKKNLYVLVEKDLKYFKLTDELFNKSIDSLIKHDYIKVENDIVTQCIYEDLLIKVEIYLFIL